jgi:hypothetical protein
MTLLADPPRANLLAKARCLARFTVGWNVVEGAIALSAAWVAGSRALAGFGLDSAVESASDAGAAELWLLADAGRRRA